MAFCVFLLVATEFMPVSLLTPLAHDFHASVGEAGQAISVSGFFAVATSAVIAKFAAHFNRKFVLVTLTAIMVLSIAVIALAPDFAVLMVARALLGIVIGGYWSLSTATVMALVPEASVSKALGVIYMGVAMATAIAAPFGSYLGEVIGWRGVFWCLVPLGSVAVAWQAFSLPAIPPQEAKPLSNLANLLKTKSIALATAAVILTYAGAFSTFTYLRPFLEARTHVTVPQLSTMLLIVGAAGFVGTPTGTALTKRHLYWMMSALPVLLACATALLLLVQHSLWGVGGALFAWGAINAAIPVCWSTWLSQNVRHDPETGGGLMVGSMQLAIMSGGAFGGFLLDRFTVTGTFIAGCVLLLASAALIGSGKRIRNDGASQTSTAH